MHSKEANAMWCCYRPYEATPNIKLVLSMTSDGWTLHWPEPKSSILEHYFRVPIITSMMSYRHLIIFGNRDTIATNRLWKRVLNHCSKTIFSPAELQSRLRETKLSTQWVWIVCVYYCDFIVNCRYNVNNCKNHACTLWKVATWQRNCAIKRFHGWMYTNIRS